MTNTTKKVLSILASTAILASFTANIALNDSQTTVKAAKHHKNKKNYKKAAKKKVIKKHNQKNSNISSSNNDSTNNSIDQSSSNDDSNDNSTPTINNDANYEAAYRAEALSEINSLRASVGVTPLVEDPALDKIADMRVAQNIARGDGSISHYDDNGNALSDIDAKQTGLNISLGENLAMRSLDDGNSTEAKDIASSLTHEYINEGPDNNDGNEHGHYENLVNSAYQRIGIGFGINPKPDSSGFVYLYDAEDFATTPIGDNNAIYNNNNSNYNSNYGNTNSVSPDGNNDDSNTLKFYTSHHPEFAPDGSTVFIENGKHLDSTGQVVNN